MGANKSLYSCVKQYSSRVSAAQNTYCGPSSRIFHVCYRPVDMIVLKLSVCPICHLIRYFLMSDRQIVTGNINFLGRTLCWETPFSPFYLMDRTMKELSSWGNCGIVLKQMQPHCSQ